VLYWTGPGNSTLGYQFWFGQGMGYEDEDDECSRLSLETTSMSGLHSLILLSGDCQDPSGRRRWQERDEDVGRLAEELNRATGVDGPWLDDRRGRPSLGFVEGGGYWAVCMQPL
jgi:hypothetical protein